jgi:glycosyltransferase involved in cell wall biosynthesis
LSKEILVGGSTQRTVQVQNQCIKGTSPQKVTVILPAYNEELSIGSIILLTRLYVDNVIVVDDGSSDRTSEIARKAGAEVIRHETNKGKGVALKTGFTAADDLGADIIVTMDSDDQHNPADIPKLIDPILKGEADMVNGSRYLNCLNKNTPACRRVGQTILDRTTNLNSGLQITDSQSGFRAFAASTKDVFSFNAQGMTIESEMLADAGKSDLRIKEVNISTRYNFESQVRTPLRYILVPLRYIVGVLKSVTDNIEDNKPLYLYALPGFALAAYSSYIDLKFLGDFFLGVGSLHLWPVILMTFLFVAGVYVTMKGIVMHSLVEVTKETDPI